MSEQRIRVNEECIRTEYDAAYDQGRTAGLMAAGARAVREGGVPFVVLPEGHKIESLEKFLDRPLTRKATATFPDLGSFLAYLEQFWTETTLLTADPQGNRVTAILDYHAGGAAGLAGHCGHTATLALRHSPEWTAWTALNGRNISQLQFAEHLEEHIGEVVEPDGAVLLEVAKHLEAKRTVSFSSGRDLTNGAVQFHYDEAVEGRGKGTVTIPTEFVLGLAPYEHGEPRRVDARLRWRLNEDKLSFQIRLTRPDLVLQAAFDEILQAIQEQAGLRPLLGSVTLR